ncbi:hypothetical protein ILYODFUR_013087 [Ilyodon furcidens]|uniref:Uncharacterized protein n=1 Tax=Ilyodon furcidens TaxID=33524 RepID=A0ABV0SNT2_9TELE
MMQEGLDDGPDFLSEEDRGQATEMEKKLLNVFGTCLGYLDAPFCLKKGNNSGRRKCIDFDANLSIFE